MSARDGARRREVVVDGRRRTFVQVGPRAGAAPVGRLLIAVHGSNQSGSRFRALAGYRLDAWAHDGTGVVVYPDSWRRGLWNDARVSTPSRARRDGVDDVAAVRAIVEQIVREHGPLTTIGLGYSNGGQLIERVILESPGVLDGAVLVGATVPAEGNLLPAAAPVVPIPMVLVHGTADRIVPFDGGPATIFGFRPRGMMRSFAESGRFWALRAGLEPEPAVEQLVGDEADGREVTMRRWGASGEPNLVQAFAMWGAGHVLPYPGRHVARLTGRGPKRFDLLPLLDGLAPADLPTRQD